VSKTKLSETPNGHDVIGDLSALTTKNRSNLVGAINEIAATPPKYAVYGVSIDLKNSNPETALTYIDDAVGMTPDTPDWYETPILKGVRPCLLKDGVVVGYLNKDNFALFEDGTPADISSGNAGDVMIEIPKIGYKITKSGSEVIVRVTNAPAKEGFCYKAHTRKVAGDRDVLYISAFCGTETLGRLRSLVGNIPTKNKSIASFRNLAHANGAGYDLLSFYPLTLLQCLFLLIYKNRDSQTALGAGVTAYGRVDVQRPTGATVDRGLSYGTSDGTKQIKFLGIEDFYGNIRTFIDGIAIDANGYILTATDGFNDETDGYTAHDRISTDISGYAKDVYATNDLGFIMRSNGGSETTYYSDWSNTKMKSIAVHGGNCGDKNSAGAFRLSVDSLKAEASAIIGARLMYL